MAEDLTKAIWGGIEAGGTKFICAVGSDPDDLSAQLRIDTRSPEETLSDVLDFFRRQPPVRALGISCFGPVDLQPGSPTYGYITHTPKPGWGMTDVVGPLRQALGVPVGFDTDVNGAALGEHRWGAAQGLEDFIYLTVGTGIGGGAMLNGRLVHGLVHPEMGHLLLPHDRQRDPFDGVCPFHGDCFEGLATGPALQARWGQPAESLPPEHAAWPLEAEYISLALANYILSFSPQRQILGGGVMNQPQLWPLIRRRVPELLNGYVHASAIEEHIDDYIVPPALGGRAGVLGAIALAQDTQGE